MGTLKINNQEVFTETAGVVSAGSNYPSGHILQIIQGVEKDIVSSTTQGWNDISTDLTVSITLSSSSNKVMVLFNAQVSGFSGWTPTTRLVRDYPSATTVVSAGTASGSSQSNSQLGMGFAPGYGGNGERAGGQSACFLDSPATTTAIEYKVQWHGRTDSSGQNYLNAMYSGAGATGQHYYGAGVSSLTLFEVKA